MSVKETVEDQVEASEHQGGSHLHVLRFSLETILQGFPI